MPDLFAWSPGAPPGEGPKERKTPKPSGHAARPGSGPAGETCKTCGHLARVRHAKVYLKCGLMEEFWTGGGKTDVRARDPACRMWEKNE
jgi:hypothetical protein